MKVSISLISLLLTTSLATAVKRQNDVPECINGDRGQNTGPWPTNGDCIEECYFTETEGDRVDQICKGHCVAVPVVGAPVVWACVGKA